jgi:RsiW-degrading membrane proteinase PrsW (M82 family)
METIAWIFLGITGLFFVILLGREFLSKKNKDKVCSICLAVSLTLVVLLIMFWSGKFNDKVILALLVGMSLLGIFYLWEKTARERFLVFRLPLLLTLIYFGYLLIEGIGYSFGVVMLLAILWGVFSLIYLYGRSGKTGGLVRKLVECCKRW